MEREARTPLVEVSRVEREAHRVKLAALDVEIRVRGGRFGYRYMNCGASLAIVGSKSIELHVPRIELEERVLKLGERLPKLDENDGKLDENEGKRAVQVLKLGERVAKLDEDDGELDENGGMPAVKVMELGDHVGELDENGGELDENEGKCAVKVVGVDVTVGGMGDYDMDDLVRLSGYSARGIRHYMQLGLLARAKYAARATRYPRETLGRLAAIRVWRTQDGTSLRQVKRDVRALTPEQVERWANKLDPIDGSPAREGHVILAPHPVAIPGPMVVSERWVRVPLVAGLDLVMREDAGEAIAQLAREIQARYRGDVGGAP